MTAYLQYFNIYIKKLTPSQTTFKPHFEYLPPHLQLKTTPVEILIATFNYYSHLLIESFLYRL